MADGDEVVGNVTDSPGTDSSAPADSSSASPASEGEFTLPEQVMVSDDLDEVEIPAEAGRRPAEGGPGPAEAGAKPPAESVKAPQAPSAAGAPPPAPKAAAPAPQAATPPVEGTTQGRTQDLGELAPKDLATELGRNRDAMLNALAEQKFALSKEEKDALEVDAVAAIPKLLARVYFDAVTASLNNLATHVPRMVQSVTSELNTTNAAENTFFSKFPGIDRNNAEHQRTVNMAANIFRQNNPNASLEQAVDAVGKMASVLLNIQAPSNGANGQPRAARSAPRPFAPASGNARTIAAQPANAPKANPFDGLGVDFD